MAIWRISHACFAPATEAIFSNMPNHTCIKVRAFGPSGELFAKLPSALDSSLFHLQALRNLSTNSHVS